MVAGGAGCRRRFPLLHFGLSDRRRRCGSRQDPAILEECGEVREVNAWYAARFSVRGNADGSGTALLNFHVVGQKATVLARVALQRTERVWSAKRISIVR